MTEFGPSPSEEDVKEVRQRWHDNTDTFDRVYDVILGVTEPTPYTQIAETADCSPNAAKKHLERLTDMGIGRADRESRPARYERNDGFLEWRDANRIAQELTIEQIIERVHRLEDRQDEFEERFRTTDPASVSDFEQDDHEAIHEQMDAISEWMSIEQDIHRYELARQLAQNDGHLLPA